MKKKGRLLQQEILCTQLEKKESIKMTSTVVKV